MKTNDLVNVLDNFIKSSSNKSILIDGPWGCGKTHQIRDFIDRNKASKIVYLSLFGYKSVDNINATLYKKTRKYKNFFLNTIRVAPTVLNATPVIKDYVPAIDFQLNVSKDVKRESIIIFDDLERIGEDISYSDFFGYINILFGCGCKVMCCVSSSHIDSSKKEQFENFKEKVFDCYFLINETNTEIFDSIFEEYHIDYVASLYNLFDNNIRKALKTKYHFDVLLKRLEEKKTSFEETRHSKTTLFIATIYTILIVFGRHKVTDMKDDNYVYNRMKNEFNENIATNYIFYTKSDNFKKYETIDGFKSLLKSILYTFLYMDFIPFEDTMIKNIKDNSQDTYNILNETYFYLSDKGKIDFYNAFKVSLENKNLVWDYHTSNSLRNLLEDDVEIEDKYIELLGDAIINTSKEEVTNISRELGFINREKLSKKEEHFIQLLNKKLLDGYTDKQVIHFESMLEKKQYEKLTLYLENLGYAHTDVQINFKNNIVSNNFYIPNITGQIDEDLWSYCHAIVRYCELNGLEEEFIKYAKEQCKKHKTNRSLVDRYHALIFYSLKRQEITKDSLIS